MRCGHRLAVLVLVVFVTACGGAGEQGDALFTRLPADSTGIAFSNDITEGPEQNIITYANFYNGGGVAAGDLTGDGRPDVYLTANQKSNKLYLNESDFHFRDVTSDAGVADDSGWTTGVAMADVNGDGRLDIYVCKSGLYGAEERRNRLYVHQGVDEAGIPQFEEQAARYGLDDPARSTHASFFDYDRDGDLDLFLLNHATGRTRIDLSLEERRRSRDPTAGNKLYRNDTGPEAGSTGGTFTNVTDEAGIVGAATGFGLSVTVSDINRDGWLDIYVANDFIEDDRLYINQRDGTFKSSLRSLLDHTSYSSMGADIADYNNDGRPDIYTADMLAEGNRRQKTLIGPGGVDYNRAMRSRGYYYQYQRNMLHLNNGNGSFSEIGQLAGVSQTDWSWAALFSDFNLDGYKDLYVTNGWRRDYTNLDFYDKVLSSNPNFLQYINDRDLRGVDLYGLVQQMPSTPIPNYAFRNRGDLTFEKVSEEWGLDQVGFSTGAATADLNSDGAPDLIVNNVDEPALVYRNNSRRQTENRYVSVRLKGTDGNQYGVGAEVQVSTPGGRSFYQELVPARGFQSSVEPVLHFGIGRADSVTIEVTWPNQERETRTGVAANQPVTLYQADARPAEPRSSRDSEGLFEEVATERGLTFTHRENSYNELEENPLLPHMHSRLGPALARGDVNGDGRSDLYVGGAQGQAPALFVQQPDGSFRQSTPSDFSSHRVHEDVDAVFVDVDRDGDQDLYVVSGGMTGRSERAYQDRVYLNEGSGEFRYLGRLLPAIQSSGGTVTVLDYNGDNYPDLFVGGRISPGAFPAAPRSYLLKNTGKGFEDVTAEVAPQLVEPGMVTDAVWEDLNGDGDSELVLAGEWMTLRAFRVGSDTASAEVTKQLGLEGTKGWWYALAARDLDGDGDTDLVATNRGRNGQIQAGHGAPVGLYAADFSKDGSVDPVLTHHLDGEEYPVYWHDLLVDEIPPFEERFDSYADYAESTIGDILTTEERETATHLTVTTFETSLFENTGDGRFQRRALPVEVQFAPLHDLVVHDVNDDNRPDLLLAGNDFTVRPQWGRADAEKGTILRNDGDLQFRAIRSHNSGFFAPQDVRNLSLLSTPRGPLVVVGVNSGQLSAFAVSSSSAAAPRATDSMPVRP